MTTPAITDRIRTDAADGGDAGAEMRCDRVAMELLQSRQGPGDSWILQGRAAKPGILTYQGPNGPYRERVTAAELRSPAHLATVERSPFTIEHPEPVGRTLVNSRNAAQLVVGDVGGDSAAPAVSFDDADRMLVSVCVRRAEAIAAIRGGKFELSCGYLRDLDRTPGVDPAFATPDNPTGAFDATQINRRNNHVAATDAARAGHDCVFRVDSDGNRLNEAPMDPKTFLALLTLAFAKLKIRCDGVEGLPTAIGQMPAAIDAVAAEVPPAAAKSIDDLKAELNAKLQEVAELMLKVKAAEAMGEPGALQALITEAADLASDAPKPGADKPAEVKADSRRREARAAIDQVIADRAMLDRVTAPTRIRADSADAIDPAKLGHAAARRAVVLARNPAMKDSPAATIDAAFAIYAAEDIRTDSDVDPLTAAFRANDATIRAGGPGPGIRADAAEDAVPLSLTALSRKAIADAHKRASLA